MIDNPTEVSISEDGTAAAAVGENAIATVPNQPEEDEQVDTAATPPDLSSPQHPQQPSSLLKTKHKIQSALPRMKQHTKQAAQRTTQAMHHVTDQMRTTLQKVRHHPKTTTTTNATITTRTFEKEKEEDITMGTTPVPDTTTTDTLAATATATTAATTTGLLSPPSPFTVTPWMDFWTADWTLLFVFTVSAACYPIYEYYPVLVSSSSSQQPPHEMTPFFVLTRVGLPWMLAAFTLGLAIGSHLSSSWDDDKNFNPWYWLFPAVTTPSSKVDPQLTTSTLETTTTVDPTEAQQQESMKEKKKHSLFLSLLGPQRSARLQFRHPSTQKILPPVKVWTTLTHPARKKDYNDDDSTTTLSSSSNFMMMRQSSSSSRTAATVRLPWQRHVTPTEDGYLMQHLLQHESFRRMLRKPPPPTSMRTTDESKEENDAASAPEPPPQQQQQLGSFDLAAEVAETLEGYVVAPLFQLRGMDIFLSEDVPEMESSTHPYLIENGLRSVPTFIVNVLTQWGNILIYFEMPKWVHSFDMTVEESDPDDVKALKVCMCVPMVVEVYTVWFVSIVCSYFLLCLNQRFLNGDASYRNDRLKMIPSLVDGPMPIRMLAPPKKEKVVNCDWMPIVWSQRDEEVGPDGSRLYPILEATLDCMTSRPIRSMAGLVKKYLHLLSVDAAIVIGTPNHLPDAEPSACLGLWRFNHIEISMCPHLPDRYQVEAKCQVGHDDVVIAADVQRASIAMKAM